jgi:hypothetical protein
MFGDGANIPDVMARKAKLGRGVLQEARIAGLVGGVAEGALAAGDGAMENGMFIQNMLVAAVAGGSRDVGRGKGIVGSVTGAALAIGEWLVEIGY